VLSTRVQAGLSARDPPYRPAANHTNASNKTQPLDRHPTETPRPADPIPPPFFYEEPHIPLKSNEASIITIPQSVADMPEEWLSNGRAPMSEGRTDDNPWESWAILPLVPASSWIG
jgi:hypothetical protein